MSVSHFVFFKFWISFYNGGTTLKLPNIFDMDFLFHKKEYYPLQQKNNLDHELDYQLHNIRSNEFMILSIYKKNEDTIILYGKYPGVLEEDTFIHLGLRIFSLHGLHNTHPRLLASFSDDYSEIEIHDIDIEEKNASKGYGSILMSHLIAVAEERKVKVITGWLSKVDENHVERLRHFYQKHGFKVDLKHSSKNPTQIGSIQRNMITD